MRRYCPFMQRYCSVLVLLPLGGRHRHRLQQGGRGRGGRVRGEARLARRREAFSPGSSTHGESSSTYGETRQYAWGDAARMTGGRRRLQNMSSRGHGWAGHAGERLVAGARDWPARNTHSGRRLLLLASPPPPPPSTPGQQRSQPQSSLMPAQAHAAHAARRMQHMPAQRTQHTGRPHHSPRASPPRSRSRCSRFPRHCRCRCRPAGGGAGGRGRRSASAGMLPGQAASGVPRATSVAAAAPIHPGPASTPPATIPTSSSLSSASSLLAGRNALIQQRGVAIDRCLR